MFLDALTNLGHDFGVDTNQIIAAHARLASNTGGDDDDISACDVFVVTGTLEVGIKHVDGGGFSNVKRLALWHAINDVEKDDVAKLFETDEVSKRATNIASTDERDLVAGHSVTFFPIALPGGRNSTWERD